MPKREKKNTPIAITAGSQKAIGTELLCKAWRHYSARKTKNYSYKSNSARYQTPQFFFVGARREIEHFNIPSIEINDLQEVESIFPRALPILKSNDPIESINIAIDCCREKAASAMVTLPVEKKIFAENNQNRKTLISKDVSSGHTEYIAHRLGIKNFAMLLVASSLRALPLTRHIPLARAIAELNEEAIVEATLLLNSSLLEDFAIKKPRLALAGVNPHAGEGGLCGLEEQQILIPAIKRLCSYGIDITGPHPPDSLFLPSVRKNFDCAINIYHDQGLIPLKLLAFNRAVNVTLGLPIVRTSPDHGTARELVGKGIADAGSLIAAIALAQKIAQRRKKLTN